MKIPESLAGNHPEVVHLAKLIKIEVDSLLRRMERTEKRGDNFSERITKLEQQAGPPTPDLPAEPDSTPETPSEKLVPVWIRDYIREQLQLQIRPVWKTIKDLTDHFVGLASKVPPGSESALRGKWRVGSKVPLNVYDGDRPVCQCHSFMDALDIVAAINASHPAERCALGKHYFGTKHNRCLFCHRTLQELSGEPPTEDFAAQLDSNPEIRAFDEAYQSINRFERSKTQRIGVYDYDSLVACLTHNFQMVFFQHAETDPQDMIQLMTAEIQNLRREREARRDNA